jgi:hypothetical protein
VIRVGTKVFAFVFSENPVFVFAKMFVTKIRNFREHFAKTFIKTQGNNSLSPAISPNFTVVTKKFFKVLHGRIGESGLASTYKKNFYQTAMIL